jgi:hypothetical protein
MHGELMLHMVMRDLITSVMSGKSGGDIVGTLDIMISS